MFPLQNKNLLPFYLVYNEGCVDVECDDTYVLDGQMQHTNAYILCCYVPERKCRK